MTTCLRFVTRESSIPGKPDLGLIGFLKSQTFFKPNTVYEVVEFDGEAVIKEVGESWIRNTLPQNKVPGVRLCWGNGVEAVLGGGKYIYLTAEEYLAKCKKDNP